MRFFLIDRITQWQPGIAAEATKNVALSEDYFDDHFPRRPLMPGVLMVEGMVQLAGLLLETAFKEQRHRDAKAVLAVLERTKFRDMVRPGDTLRYRVEVTSLNADEGKAAAQAFCGDRTVATTGMVFAFTQTDDPTIDARRSALLKTWMQTS
jgi:3-hydroxyacyl-[acyl-carrier-protein] dehydratase